MGYVNPTTPPSTQPSRTAARAWHQQRADRDQRASAANPAHIASFPPGTSTTAFTVTWSPTSKTDPVTWALMGRNFSFNDQITSCTSKPVPVVANETFGAIAVAGSCWVPCSSAAAGCRPLAMKRPPSAV